MCVCGGGGGGGGGVAERARGIGLPLQDVDGGEFQQSLGGSRRGAGAPNLLVRKGVSKGVATKIPLHSPAPSFTLLIHP